MAFAQEGSWGGANVNSVASSQGIGPTFVGGGAELLIVMMAITNDNGCTGAHFQAHANLTIGTPYIGLSINGMVMACLWATWNGAAGTPTLTIIYDGGTTGANVGTMNYGLFTGYNPNIIASPGPSATGTGTGTTAQVTITGVSAGSLVVAYADNSGSANFSGGSGYTLIGNSSAHNGHIAGLEVTTGLSEPGGTANPQMTMTSSTWNMLGVAFPSSPPPIPGSIFMSQRKVLYFI